MMLVMTMREDDRVEIEHPGTDPIPKAYVQILSINRGKIRIGFDFPPDVMVNREDVARSKRLHGSTREEDF
jgi:sRNA-binding carbon storage regulator CsrA